MNTDSEAAGAAVLVVGDVDIDVNSDDGGGGGGGGGASSMDGAGAGAGATMGGGGDSLSLLADDDERSVASSGVGSRSRTRSQDEPVYASTARAVPTMGGRTASKRRRTTAAVGEAVHPPSTYDRANCCNRLCFRWTSGLIYKGYRRALEREDVPALTKHEDAEGYRMRFEAEWEKENAKPYDFLLLRQPPVRTAIFA